MRFFWMQCVYKLNYGHSESSYKLIKLERQYYITVYLATMASNVVRHVKTKWHLIDAEGVRVGKLSTHISKILTGKNKPTYSPHMEAADHVVVVNARKVAFTGKKYEQKVYRWHTGYPGGVKTITPKELSEVKNQPELILKKSVKGMLPKNRLQKLRMKKLHIFPDSEHTFQDKVFDIVSAPEKILDIRKILK
eukprot:snap_masked-scaffold_3-processed-gene-16.47-mRNA-1 protein AED:0.09 eAED:0.09 QI:0/-1/0/1/-1/1/1/0/192